MLVSNRDGQKRFKPVEILLVALRDVSSGSPRALRHSGEEHGEADRRPRTFFGKIPR
jgi:hypothetical protein